jgi:hypothetical protein
MHISNTFRERFGPFTSVGKITFTDREGFASVILMQRENAFSAF